MFYPKISESKLISAKNKFKTPIQILNAQGSKPFIKSTILNSLLNPDQKEQVIDVKLNIQSIEEKLKLNDIDPSSPNQHD